MGVRTCAGAHDVERQQLLRGGTYPTTSIRPQTSTMPKFYFATAGDIEQCDIGTNNLRNASNCSVVTSISGVSAETAPSLSADNMTMYLDRAGVLDAIDARDGNTWSTLSTMYFPAGLHRPRSRDVDGDDVMVHAGCCRRTAPTFEASTLVDRVGRASRAALRVSTSMHTIVIRYLLARWLLAWSTCSDAACSSAKNYHLYVRDLRVQRHVHGGTPLTIIDDDVSTIAGRSSRMARSSIHARQQPGSRSTRCYQVRRQVRCVRDPVRAQERRHGCRAARAAAWPGTFEQLVAIKTIRPEYAETPAVRAMFLDEAAILARLNHPGIATVHDFGEEGGTLYMVMEYVAGCRFATSATCGRRRSVAARAIAEACRGLHAAHELRDPSGR